MKSQILPRFIALAACVLTVQGVYAQILNSCDQWANITTNGYTVYNNIWGSGAGSQCLTVNAFSDWWVTANHPNTSGIKSYPNVERKVNLNVDNMGAVSSTFAVTRPSGGSYSTTYDIWYNNYAYEVMLWMNYTGAVGPIASSYNCGGACPEATNVNVGGHTWNIYRGSNGANAVFSFLRTSQTNSGTVDITAISQWLRSNGWFGNVNLHSIQLGFEITSSNGSQQYRVTNFSVATGTASNLNVSPTSLSVASGGGNNTISVTSNVSWSVTDNQSWISVSPTSGSNNGSFTVTTSNNTSASRSGTVTVTGGGITRTINVSQSGTGGCTQTTITPFVQVNNGTWQQTSSASVSAGGTVKFGPQPTTGGSWSWTGPNGFTASTREVTLTNIQTSQAGTYTARYTNTSGCQSTQAFGVTISGGGNNTIVVRARGTSGAESIQLRVNNTTIATWTLTTSFQNYSTAGSGAVTVHFINDSGGRDVQVDYVTIGGVTHQSESQSTNTAVWVNNSCGGSNSEWLNCNGFISYANSGARLASTGEQAETEQALPGLTDIQTFPNPVIDQLQVRIPDEFKGGTISLVNPNGKVFLSAPIMESQHRIDMVNMPAGLYIVAVRKNLRRIVTKVWKK
jgi:hypothetical protein